jgi:hypothetical protein
MSHCRFLISRILVLLFVGILGRKLVGNPKGDVGGSQRLWVDMAEKGTALSSLSLIERWNFQSLHRKAFLAPIFADPLSYNAHILCACAANGNGLGQPGTTGLHHPRDQLSDLRLYG